MSNGQRTASPRHEGTVSQSQSLRTQALQRLKKWQSPSISSTPPAPLLSNSNISEVERQESLTRPSTPSYVRELRAQAQRRLSTRQASAPAQSNGTALPVVDDVAQIDSNLSLHDGTNITVSDVSSEDLTVSDSDDAESFSDDDFQFYPSYALAGSPLYHAWVKLSANDVHTHLLKKEGYQHIWVKERTRSWRTPHLLFFKNHPVQFVQLTGIVVGIDQDLEKLWLFTIDDGSGMSIDVICSKPLTKPSNSSSFSEAVQEECKEETAEILLLSGSVKSMVDIGVVLQIRGTITMFRRQQMRTIISPGPKNGYHRPVNATRNHEQEVVRQISLHSLKRIDNTQQEIELMHKREHYRSTVLQKPWRLTRNELANLQQKSGAQAIAKRKKEQRYAERDLKRRQAEQRDCAIILQDYETDEQRRVSAAEQARQQADDLSTRKVSSSHTVDACEVIETRMVSPKSSCEQPQLIAQETSFNSATDSFGATASQKSALLFAAFGQFSR